MCSLPRSQSANFRLARLFSLLALVIAAWAASAFESQAQLVPVPLTQWDGRQAAIIVTNLDVNPKPDLIVLAGDNSSGTSSFRYSIGWNMGADGVAQNWEANAITVPGPGGELKGVGAALANTFRDARPELLLAGLVSENGQLGVRYKRGRGLDKQGHTNDWDADFLTAADNVGPATGLDVIVTNLDDNPRPDLIVILYDAGEQTLRYKIGWNLKNNGEALQWDGAFTEIRGIGNFARGARAKIVNLDDDPRPELMVAFVDPATGTFAYAVGWNLGEDGRAQKWERGAKPLPSVGAEGHMAGIAISNFNAVAQPDLVVMAYDAAAGAQSFQYQIVPDFAVGPTIDLELFKLAAVNWPPDSIDRGGEVFTLPSIYARIGITLNVQQRDGALEDQKNGACYDDADLDALLTFIGDKYPDPPSQAQSRWRTRTLFVTCYTQRGVLGTMFSHDERRAFAVFMNTIDSPSKVLRTFAHELGHSLCLYHSDGDAMVDSNSNPVEDTGYSIMNQTKALADHWGYGWHSGELHKIYERSMRRWRAGSAYAFESCH